MRNRVSTPSVPVYRVGVGFMRTAELLFHDNPTDFDWVYPFIANASFSIELFLKSCLAEDEYTEFKFGVSGDEKNLASWFRYVKSNVSAESKTHNLTELFGKLSEKRKAKIRAEYEKTAMSQKYPKMGSLLNDLNGLFEAARYGYSRPDLLPKNISIIIDSARFFHKVVPMLEDIE